MASDGPSPLRSAALTLVPILTFGLGFLLGGMQSGPSASIEANEYEREILRLVRELPDELRQPNAATLGPNPRSNLATVDRSQGDGMRLPALDEWLLRIDQAVSRLEESAARASETAPRPQKELLRLASDPNLPRKDAALKRFIEEQEYVESTDFETDDGYDIAWDAFTNKYNYLSMEEVLDRFGRPDEINVDGSGSTNWEYYDESIDKYGNHNDWGVSLYFTDSMLIDFSGWWNRDQ